VSTLQSTVNTINTYAIKSAGTSGQVWTSDGSGAGKWADIEVSASVGTGVNVSSYSTFRSLAMSGKRSDYFTIGYFGPSGSSSSIVSITNAVATIISNDGSTVTLSIHGVVSGSYPAVYMTVDSSYIYVYYAKGTSITKGTVESKQISVSYRYTDIYFYSV